MIKHFIKQYTENTSDSVTSREEMILGHWNSWRKENGDNINEFVRERADSWLDPITFAELVLINEFESWRQND